MSPNTEVPKEEIPMKERWKSRITLALTPCKAKQLAKGRNVWTQLDNQIYEIKVSKAPELYLQDGTKITKAIAKRLFKSLS